MKPETITLLPKTAHPCCENHCRLWQETNDWKLPASEHSPSCENYKRRHFFRVVPKGEKGPACIMHSKEEVLDFCEVLDFGVEQLKEYDITTILLTRDQYANLQEFEGF